MVAKSRPSIWALLADDSLVRARAAGIARVHMITSRGVFGRGATDYLIRQNKFFTNPHTAV